MLKFIFILLFVSSALAQTTITGYVRDAANGDALPAANLQIEGTYQGAITNREGRYILKIEHLPAVILIRYIGYESKRITINSDFSSQVDIELKPSPIEMQNVVITGEDPAVFLMRNVIAKKQRWFGKLKNFKADVYSRLSLENDSGIVMLSESLGDMYWDRIKGIRAVIKSKRATKNVNPKDLAFSLEDAVVNFYDDDVTIQNSRFVGPTHPDALSYYDFKLIGQRNLDGRIVYDIRVNTKSKLQPTFVGTVSVLDADSVLIAVDLKPSEFAIFPMPIRQWDVAYKQQFSNFGREYWLPVDIRMNGLTKIGLPGLEFPLIKYGQVSAFNDYLINQSMPDSLYKQKRRMVVDSVALQKPNQFDSARVFIPLSEREDSAYAGIKRGDSFAKAFKPTGMLSKYVKMEDDYNDSVAAENVKPKSAFKKLTNDLSPQLGFNRVEGGRLGLKYEHEFNRTWKAFIRGGYATALKDPFYGTGAEYRWGRRFVHFVKVSFYAGVTPRFDSDNYAVWMGQMLPFTGYRDYFDYYKAREIRLSAGYYFRSVDMTIETALINDRQASVKKRSDWDIIGRSYRQRINPVIDEGTLRSVQFSVQYGDDYVPLGVVGDRNAKIVIEHSPASLSDFDYTTFRGEINWRIPTFMQRRFLPNVLDIRAVGGTYAGNLPIQKRAILDGSLGIFTPFGTFKTLRSRAYEGEKFAAVFWEHNFRTLLFEIIGLRALAKRNIGIAVFGAHGRTWIKESHLASSGYAPVYSDKLHQEIGGSINGLFGLLRLDAAKRLNHKGFYFGVSMARLF